MHYFFTRQVDRVEYAIPGTGVSFERQGNEWITPGGFEQEAHVLEPKRASFSGFQLLQEYFCSPHKFWFVNLRGIQHLQHYEEDLSFFEVKIHFKDRFPKEFEFDEQHLRLHCVPAVNMFVSNSQPVLLDSHASSYRLVPRGGHKKELIHDVIRVEGISRRRRASGSFSSLYEFKYQASQGDAFKYFYATSLRPGVDDLPDTFLTIGSANEKDDVHDQFSQLVVKTLSSNGRITKDLKRGASLSMDNDVAVITSVTDAGPLLFAPRDSQDHYFWRLIAHLSLNFSSITNREELVAVLDLYDWSRGKSNRQRLESIQALHYSSDTEVIKRCIVHGTKITLEVHRKGFNDRGDIALFGLVLSRFLSAYASINSFVKLEIKTLPENPEHPDMTWAFASGQKRLV